MMSLVCWIVGHRWKVYVHRVVERAPAKDWVNEEIDAECRRCGEILRERGWVAREQSYEVTGVIR